MKPTTTFAPASNLNSLSLDELFIELDWLQEQPDSQAIRQAWDECLTAIERRQDLIEDWNHFLAG